MLSLLSFYLILSSNHIWPTTVLSAIFIWLTRTILIVIIIVICLYIIFNVVFVGGFDI